MSDRQSKRNPYPFHLKRVDVKIVIPHQEEKAQVGHAMISDFSPKGVGIFVSDKIPEDEVVELQFQKPIEFKIKGRIAWCQERILSGKVISTQKYYFRLGIEFIFDEAITSAEAFRFYEELKALTQK